MHASNVWAATIASGSDLLADCLRVASSDPSLGLRDIEAITLVAARPGCSSEWLRGRIGLSQSGTVRLVDRLTALDLLRRSRTGSREVALAVTTEGGAVLARWSAARDAAMDTAMGALAPSDRQTLVDLMAKALHGAPRERTAADRACRTCDWPACEPHCPVDESVAT